jgi:hypothetical protein
VIGENTPLTVPFARVYTGESDGQVTEVNSLDLSLVPLELAGTHWIGADVTGTDLDEAVGLRTDGSLVMVRLDNGCTGAACVMPVVTPPSPVMDPVGLLAEDIDGDGDLDLLAMMRNRDAQRADAQDASVVVWWNDNGFAASRSQILNGKYADAAVVDLDRDGTRELIVLERAASGADSGKLSASHLEDGAFRTFATLAPATDGVALQAADLNGDALDDLVVVTGVERNAPRELAIYTQTENRIPSGEE